MHGLMWQEMEYPLDDQGHQGTGHLTGKPAALRPWVLPSVLSRYSSSRPNHDSDDRSDPNSLRMWPLCQSGVGQCRTTALELATRDTRVRSGHRYGDLISTPERQGPRRVVEPRDRLACGFDVVIAQSLSQLLRALCDGISAAVATESQHGDRFSGDGDEPDIVVSGLRKSLYRPLRRHEEPNRPAVVGIPGLCDGGGHRYLVPAGLLSHGRGHRDVSWRWLAPNT